MFSAFPARVRQSVKRGPPQLISLLKQNFPACLSSMIFTTNLSQTLEAASCVIVLAFRPRDAKIGGDVQETLRHAVGAILRRICDGKSPLRHQTADVERANQRIELKYSTTCLIRGCIERYPSFFWPGPADFLERVSGIWSHIFADRVQLWAVVPGKQDQELWSNARNPGAYASRIAFVTRGVCNQRAERTKPLRIAGFRAPNPDHSISSGSSKSYPPVCAAVLIPGWNCV